MKSIDPFLNKVYDAEKYHCVHYLLEAAQYLLDVDYTNNFIGLTSSLHETLRTSRHTVIKNRLRDKDEKPKQGDIVLMTNINNSSHVGLFYCGNVLHLTEMGVHFSYVVSLNKFYKRIRYYEPHTHSEKSA